MTSKILHESLTPVNTTFQVSIGSGRGVSDDNEVIVFTGNDVTSQGEFERIMASPEQACAAAIAILWEYAPKVLRKRIRVALSDGIPADDLNLRPAHTYLPYPA